MLGQFSADSRPHVPPKPPYNVGARPAVPVAPKNQPGRPTLRPFRGARKSGQIAFRYPVLFGYLKAVWPLFWGCAFEVWPSPGARKNLQRCGGLRPCPLFESFPGPPGPAIHQKRTPTNQAILPSSYPLGGPAGPGCHFPNEIFDFGPMSARIRGTCIFCFYFGLKCNRLLCLLVSAVSSRFGGMAGQELSPWAQSSTILHISRYLKVVWPEMFGPLLGQT